MAVKKYKRRSGWLPYFELACGTYFLYMCWFAITTFNYPTLPFLLLFVCGYYWAGFGTLYQEYQDRLRYNRQTQPGIRNRPVSRLRTLPPVDS